MADPPKAPLLVFDGDCGFCRQWVGRWRGITGDRVAYRPWQEVAGQFPEIGKGGSGPGLADRAGRDGHGRGGGRLPALRLVGEKRWLGWMYESMPTFAAVAEGVYASRLGTARGGGRDADALGDVAERPRYRRMRSIFLRGLGIVYLVAFWSLAVQVDGLIGGRGILPAGEFLEADRAASSAAGVLAVPDAALARPSDRSLHVLCWGGVAVERAARRGGASPACLLACSGCSTCR